MCARVAAGLLLGVLLIGRTAQQRFRHVTAILYPGQQEGMLKGDPVCKLTYSSGSIARVSARLARSWHAGARHGHACLGALPPALTSFIRANTPVSFGLQV